MSDKEKVGDKFYSGLESMKRVVHPAAERNKAPIFEIIKNYIQSDTKGGRFLEISSGFGQHIAYFAPHYPQITFYPSEYEEELLESIAINCSGIKNVMEPIRIDVSMEFTSWPSEIFQENFFGYIYCCNLLHVSPIACSHGLFKNAGKLLKSNGLLFTYGAHAVDGKITPKSNEEFDASLRAKDPEWGLRDIKELEKIAEANQICLIKIYDMPANNKMLIWRKS